MLTDLIDIATAIVIIVIANVTIVVPNLLIGDPLVHIALIIIIVIIVLILIFTMILRDASSDVKLLLFVAFGPGVVFIIILDADVVFVFVGSGMLIELDNSWSALLHHVVE